jgi:hypothetical protein
MKESSEMGTAPRHETARNTSIDDYDGDVPFPEPPFQDLKEPPEAKPEVPRCHLGKCAGKRKAEFRTAVLLYPVVPVANGPTLTDRGARVTIGYTCKKHKKAWTLESFLASDAWRASHHGHFTYDFGSDVDKTLSSLEVTRI